MTMASSSLPFGERRLNHRKPCFRTIQVNYRDGACSGHLRDLGLGGAFIEPSEAGADGVGQELYLTIPFGLKRDALTVRARVAWTAADGMGVRFIAPRADG
jgi:hypothetical protein